MRHCPWPKAEAWVLFDSFPAELINSSLLSPILRVGKPSSASRVPGIQVSVSGVTWCEVVSKSSGQMLRRVVGNSGRCFQH